MGFTLRFIIGTVLFLSCSTFIQTKHLNRRQINQNGDSKTTDKLQKIETETTTPSVVANLSGEINNKPKTDNSIENKTIDKQNSIEKLQNSEKDDKSAETGRSIDIQKYVSKEFHSKNNVYTLPLSPDTEKFVNRGDYDFHHQATTHKDSGEFNFDTELTTPKSLIFDRKYKEAVESVDQKLEHIDIEDDDESHETSEEVSSNENINVEKLFNETKKNETKANLHYLNYKNIVTNNTGSKNNIRKDVVVEAGTNLNFQKSYVNTTIIDDDDSENKNNTIVKEPDDEKKVETSTLSNIIPVNSDLDNAESSTSKSTVLTTRKSVNLTKPPSNKNLSHISILSNNIETETIKAINLLLTTEKAKGQDEVPEETAQKEVPINVSKRPAVVISEILTTQPSITVPNEINMTAEISTVREHQINSTIVDVTTATEQVVTVTPMITTTLQEFPTTTEASTVVTNISEDDSVTSSSNGNKQIIENETTINPVEIETMTSIVTETSTTPWERVTTEMMTTRVWTETVSALTTTPIRKYTTESIPTTTEIRETTTLFSSTYQADSTVEPNTEKVTTTTPEITTLTPTTIVTTDSSLRTSKGLVFQSNTEATATVELTTFETTTEGVVTILPENTEAYRKTTTENIETTTSKSEQETTTFQNVKNRSNVLPEFRFVTPVNDSTTETETTTENQTITSDFYEHNNPEDNSGTIAAITISSIGAVCLILVAGLLVIMRKRQKRFNYGQRCRPVSLDDYSMDNVSVYNSVRRKGMLRGSKRSYGNPAFEDPVCISHPLNFPALGKFANNLEDIKAEFEDIPQITARTNELPEGCDTKNRYANVIPLPETRVFLSFIEGYPNSDYINANYVTGPKNVKGYYIASQAPMQNTVDDFWRMIWEQQCKVILMLTHLFENGVEKCVDYLPPSEVLDCHRLFGDFQVTLKKREVKDKYIISSLQLKNMVSNSWREVTHFWYLGWPEKGVPTESNSLIAFLIEARSYMKSSSLDRKDVTNGNLTNGVTKNEINPVVVHCSPGTGRTGVVIACDIAIREFEQNRLVDVPRIVYKIRRDRASAVQTKEQYAFIYKVINLYATKLTGGALDSL